MQRRWQIEPDALAKVEDGSTAPVISQAAITNAAAELALILHRSGGTGSIVTMRNRTLLPGEAVTTGAIVEWRDRTDAKPQPERIAAPEPVAAVVAPQNGEANGAALADLRGELDDPVGSDGENQPQPMRDQPLPPPPLPPQRNEVRIVEGAEAEAQHRYDASAQHGGQDEELVDESEVPPRLRG
jgi:hypothetical protein